MKMHQRLSRAVSKAFDTLRVFPGLMLVLTLGCSSHRRNAAAKAAVTEESGFDWPLPTGWRSETILFPLEFAPDIPHQGVEELRFAPGFSKPQTTDYCSYAFVWWLKDQSPIDRTVLSDELVRYFRGLAMTFGGKNTVSIPLISRRRS
jgi:hypothetical protein